MSSLSLSFSFCFWYIDGTRERTLTEHLKKIYGPSFSIEAELSSLPSSTSLGSPSSSSNPSSRRRSGPMNGFIAARSPLSPAGQLESTSQQNTYSTLSNGTSISGDTEEEVISSPVPFSLPASFDPEAMMEQLLAVQTLVQRFERRLLSRESELIKKEQDAKDEIRKLEGISSLSPR